MEPGRTGQRLQKREDIRDMGLDKRSVQVTGPMQIEAQLSRRSMAAFMRQVTKQGMGPRILMRTAVLLGQIGYGGRPHKHF